MRNRRWTSEQLEEVWQVTRLWALDDPLAPTVARVASVNLLEKYGKRNLLKMLKYLEKTRETRSEGST